MTAQAKLCVEVSCEIRVQGCWCQSSGLGVTVEEDSFRSMSMSLELFQLCDVQSFPWSPESARQHQCSQVKAWAHLLKKKKDPPAMLAYRGISTNSLPPHAGVQTALHSGSLRRPGICTPADDAKPVGIFKSPVPVATVAAESVSVFRAHLP